MIEVFKTNVQQRSQAKILIDQIHQLFTDYNANFDLDDCDKILRVQCKRGPVEPSILIELLHRFGFYAEVLPDIEPVSMYS